MDLLKKYFPQINDDQLNAFFHFEKLIKEWNKKINLISRKDVENIQIHHIIHSLSISKLISFKDSSLILDIGTGSGCILLSILKELKFSRGIGIDISRKAIQTAIINSKKLNLLNRVKFKLYDINNYNMGKYDLIVSNPPYIPSQDIKNLSKDITKYEPINALDGGVDGLDLIKKVIYKSNFLIKKNGLLSLEIGYQQYKKVSNILKRNGFREISKEYDYNRNVRCIISTKVKFLKF